MNLCEEKPLTLGSKAWRALVGVFFVSRIVLLTPNFPFEWSVDFHESQALVYAFNLLVEYS